MEYVMRVGEATQRFGRARIRTQLRRRVWQRPLRGVLVLHNGPLSREDRQAVAVAACPPGSVLGGRTALEHERFDGFDDERIFIVLPEGAKTNPLAGVVHHWSTMLDDGDVHPRREPLRTRPARSLVDIASWTPNARYARAVIISGLQQGTVDARQIRDALSRRGPCRHRSLIVESMLDADGGVQSLPERDFGDLWAMLGLPPLSRQRRVKGKHGRYYLDIRCDELDLAIEVHGLPHHAVERWDADLRRANEIVIEGERLLVFSSYAIRHEREAVADQLIRAARANGWTGTPAIRDLSNLPRVRDARRIHAW